MQYNNWSVSVRDHNYKDNIDSDLIVDVMKCAYTQRMQHIILFSGDSDYVRMVKAVKDLGIKVTVVSTLANNRCSDLLHREADSFVDLMNLKMFAPTVS